MGTGDIAIDGSTGKVAAAVVFVPDDLSCLPQRHGNIPVTISVEISGPHAFRIIIIRGFDQNPCKTFAAIVAPHHDFIRAGRAAQDVDIAVAIDIGGMRTPGILK